MGHAVDDEQADKDAVPDVKPILAAPAGVLDFLHLGRLGRPFDEGGVLPYEDAGAAYGSVSFRVRAAEVGLPSAGGTPLVHGLMVLSRDGMFGNGYGMCLALGDGIKVGAKGGGVEAVKDEVIRKFLHGKWVVASAGPVGKAVELWVLCGIVVVFVLSGLVGVAVGVDVAV